MFTDEQLNHMAEEIGLTLSGVVCKDMLPKNPRGAWIINMQSSHDPITGKLNGGTHWLGLYVPAGDIAYYFDSFGLPPPLEVKRRIRGKRLIYNTRDIQNIHSYYCGLYALLFLYWMTRDQVRDKRERFMDYISMFTSEPEKNLTVLKELYQRVPRVVSEHRKVWQLVRNHLPSSA